MVGKLDGLETVTKTWTCAEEDCDKTFSLTIAKCFANVPMRCEECAQKRVQEDKRRALIEYRRTCVKNAGIADRYLVWDPHRARELGSDKLLEWLLAHAEGSMWIAGPNGVGKTHAVCYAAFRRIVEHDDTVRILRCSEFLLKAVQLRQGDYRNVEESQKLVADAIRTKILVLDDLGKEKLSVAKAEILWEIIDQRERDKKRLWITTNLSPGELLVRLGDDYGPGIMERLRRACPDGCRWPEASAPDDQLPEELFV